MASYGHSLPATVPVGKTKRRAVMPYARLVGRFANATPLFSLQKFPIFIYHEGERLSDLRQGRV